MTTDRNDPIDWDAGLAELLDDEGTPALVDSVEAQRGRRVGVAGLRASQRRALLPGWLRSRRQFADTVKWAVGFAGHTIAYHLLRTPKYALKLAWRSLPGLWRVVSGVFRWLFDWEGEKARQATASNDNFEMYLKLSRQRDQRVRARGGLAIAGLIGLIVLVCVGLSMWQGLSAGTRSWVGYGLLALVVGILGLLGRPADKPLLDTAVLVPRVAKLTSDVVVRALSVLGIAGITQALAKNSKAIGFPAPIMRDGPGWRADVDLPGGVTAAEVIDRRDKLSAALGRPLGCVWPEGQHDIHPGRLTIWVGDQDMATSKQPTWPLAKSSSGTVDLFKTFPFGTDPRGRAVNMELPYTNLLIGSIPGVGKTFSLRLPLLAAALDPHVEQWVFELKGTGDLESLSKVATRYASGADDDTCELALQALRDLRKECQRRAETIKGLPKSVCPENKVTPQLARQKSLRLHLLVLAIDECQELFTHPEFGKEAGELAEKIVKLGRALGVILMLATQRPDAKSLPTGITANVGTRFCLRVMGQMENDMILGTSMYRNGVRATMFTKRDKGVGYLVGAGDEPQITRTFYVDGPTAEKICHRARAARELAGTLTGHAAGIPVQPTSSTRDTLLDDVLTVLSGADHRMWTEHVAEHLTKLRPDLYADMTRDQLTAALRAHGVEMVQVFRTDPATGKNANRRGVDRADITKAVTERDRRRKGNIT